MTEGDEKRSDVACPFCGVATVGVISQQVETGYAERNMSLDNVNRLLAGEPMAPEENVHVERRVVVGSTLTVTHFDGTVHEGNTPPDWRWPE